MSEDIARFVESFGRGAEKLRGAQRQTMIRVAEVAKIALWNAPGAPHGDVAKRKVSVGYNVVERGGAFEAKVGWRGPLQLVDHDTKAHFIVPKGYGGSRRKRQQAAAFVSVFSAPGGSLSDGNHALLIGGNLRPFAHHPGTKGKHFFAAGRAVAERVVPEAYARQTRVTLATVFGG